MRNKKRPTIQVNLEEKTFEIDESEKIKLSKRLSTALGTTGILSFFGGEGKVSTPVGALELCYTFASKSNNQHRIDEFTNRFMALVNADTEKIVAYLERKDLLHPLFTFLSKTKKISVRSYDFKVNEISTYIGLVGYMKFNIQS